MPLNRAARRTRTRRSRTAVGATVLALSGLASAYAQVIRMQAAYATACTAVTNEATFATALGQVAAGTCDTISFTSSITLTANAPAVDISRSGSTSVVINGNGNTITAGDGTVAGGFTVFSVNLGSGDDLDISNLTITGASQPTPTLSGGAMNVAGDLPGVTLTLTNVTVTDSYAYDSGGAVYAEVNTLIIADSTFSGNDVGDDDGGDIYFDGGGAMTVTDSTFTGSTAGGGGGSIYVDDGTSLTVSGSTFENLSAQSGGAIYVQADDLAVTITDTTFTDNKASDMGGALFVYAYDVLTLDGVAMEGNEGDDGGALFAAYAEVSVTDSTFSNNTSTGGEGGGAVRVYTGEPLTVTSSTFEQNSNETSGEGGAILAEGVVTVTSSSFIDNSSVDGAGAISALGEVTVTNSTLTGNEGFRGVVDAYTDLDLNFSTIYANDVLPGGSTEGIIVGGNLTATASVIMSGADVTDECTVTGSGTLDFVITTDTSCGTATDSDSTAVAADLGFGPLGDTGVAGGRTFKPSLTSVLATLAPATDLSTGVTVDQVGSVRGPAGTAHSFTIGARQAGETPVWTAASPPAATVGTAYSYTFAATGSVPITFARQSGSFPGGLTLDPATGELSGTPTTAGSFSFAVRATNSIGHVDTATLTVVVSSGDAKPARPQRPTILAGSSEVDVAVQPGSGGGTVSRFVVTATPGSRTCTITGASGGRCTVTGLIKGTTYTFSAVARGVGGVSPASMTSEVAVPGRTPNPGAQDLTARVRPGGHTATQGGQRATAKVRPNDDQDGLIATAATWSARVAARTSTGRRAPMANGRVVVVPVGGAFSASGQGFKPGTTVQIFLDPPVAVRSGATSRLAVLTVDRSGEFSGQGPLPGRIRAGDHTLQLVGVSRGNEVRALTVGITVIDVPGPVRHLRAVSSGAGEVTADWRRPLPVEYAEPTGYRVWFRLTLAGEWSAGESTTVPGLTVDGLVSGCRYDVKVAAVSAAGRGPSRVTTVDVGTGGRSRLPLGDLRCRI